jgi:hypothetical protein
MVALWVLFVAELDELTISFLFEREHSMVVVSLTPVGLLLIKSLCILVHWILLLTELK